MPSRQCPCSARPRPLDPSVALRAEYGRSRPERPGGRHAVLARLLLLLLSFCPGQGAEGRLARGCGAREILRHAPKANSRYL
jgi:hypothetical protein